ncbi:MAG: glycoside hydrolase family 5 protein [Oscillospiraceae bacterium]|nr:glycoside hydrolase family 5 protein [Oscillospiraceae bacterium]
MKQKLLSLLLPVVMLFGMAGCAGSDSSSVNDTTSAPSSSVAESRTDSSNVDTSSSEEDSSTPSGTEDASDGGFKVEGTKLLDANGNEFIFRGVNHAHTWFNGALYDAIPAIADAGCNSVRIVLACGKSWSKNNLEDVNRVIEACKQNDLVVVLEVHDGTGEDNAKTLQTICDYWIEIKDALIGNEEYVILNIANEWMGSSLSGFWANNYAKIIPQLRDAGIKNTIMVDAGGWGQHGQCIAERGADVLASDVLGNTMFSVHMYGTAGGSEKKIKSILDGAREQNLCICVGEFGYTHSDGDVKEDYLMQYCEEQGIGYLGWSWKGNGGGVEYLDIALTWDGSQLSADWGDKLINGEYGIKATSKKCSIFE